MGQGFRREESSFCEQKEAKKLHLISLAQLLRQANPVPAANGKSFFASFCSQKEVLLP
jgi:hypothetical protein